jgi:hypothetical protein
MTKYVVARFTSTFYNKFGTIGSYIVMEFGPHDITDVIVEDLKFAPPLVAMANSKVIVLFSVVSTITFLQSILFVSQPSVVAVANLTAPAGDTVPKVITISLQYIRLVEN